MEDNSLGANMEKTIALSGFIADIHSPSTWLQIVLDGKDLSWTTYKKLGEDLEKLLAEIDKKYSARSPTKGRSISLNSASHNLEFSPFPSKFSNTLSNARSFVYKFLMNDYCVLLEEIGRRNVYLLPKGVAPMFLEEVEKINKETIAPLREEMTKFVSSDDFSQIEKLISSAGIDPRGLSTALTHTIKGINNFSADIVPVSFDWKAVGTFTSVENIEGLKLLMAQLERKEHEYRANVVTDILRKFNRLIEQPVIGPRLAPQVDRLEKMCDSLGLTNITEKVLKPLHEVVMAKPSLRAGLCEKYFGNMDLKKGAAATLKASFGG